MMIVDTYSPLDEITTPNSWSYLAWVLLFMEGYCHPKDIGKRTYIRPYDAL